MTAVGRFTLGLCFALVTSASVIAAAQTGPKERRDDRREIRGDKKEIAKDRKELHDDKKDPSTDKKELREDRKELREDKKELAEDKKELREDRREAIEDWRKKRVDRRKEHLKEFREKWGLRLGRPEARAELKVHVRRLARLNWALRLATDANKTAAVERINKMIARENARNDAVMAKISMEGAKP